MKRDLSAAALHRVRKISDAVQEALVNVTTKRPQHTADDSFFDYGGRGRQSRKGWQKPNLKRSQSHRNICKDDIRPYLPIHASRSTNDLLFADDTIGDDVEHRRAPLPPPLRSRFSVDTEDLSPETPLGRKEKKGFVETAMAMIQRPQRAPRPAGEGPVKDVFEGWNVVDLAPPPASRAREQRKEDGGRQKNTAAGAGGATTARPGGDMRHRGSTTQAREASGHRAHHGRLHDNVRADNAVGPPVPPKDHTPARMASPFATLPSRSRARGGPGASLTRKLSTNSAPDGTVGVSKFVPVSSRPETLDERRQPLDMRKLGLVLTGQVETSAQAGSSYLYRSSSLGNANSQASSRSLHRSLPRPVDGRGHRIVRPDENQPRHGRVEHRPHQPSPLGTRQPSMAPLPPRADAYLPEPRHKRHPSEMDLPRDVHPEDGEEVQDIRRAPDQIYATLYAPPTPRASVTARPRELQPPPQPSAGPSTRMTTKVQGSGRVKEVPRPIQMSMTITTPSQKLPDSYDNDVVVIGPCTWSPAMSLASTAASIGDFHDDSLIQQLMTRTDDPRMNRRDTFASDQLRLALGDMEGVRPLSIHKKRSGAGKQQNGYRW